MLCLSRALLLPPMRQVFSVGIQKRIYTLMFDRGSNSLARMQKEYNKLLQARALSSVVVSSPEAVKSLFLKYIDLLQVPSNVLSNA